MPSVRVRNDEPFDVILRRFRRSCEKAGIFSEIRKREYYEKPTSVRKRKGCCCRQARKKAYGAPTRFSRPILLD